MNECLHVVATHIGATGQHGAGLGSKDQVLGGPQTSTPADPVIDKVRCAGAARTTGTGKFHSVTNQFLGHRNTSYHFMETQHVFATVKFVNRFGSRCPTRSRLGR